MAVSKFNVLLYIIYDNMNIHQLVWLYDSEAHMLQWLHIYRVEARTNICALVLYQYNIYK